LSGLNLAFWEDNSLFSLTARPQLVEAESLELFEAFQGFGVAILETLLAFFSHFSQTILNTQKLTSYSSFSV